MSKDADVDMREAFLCANANRQFIAHEMAGVLRELLRAVASDNDGGFAASEKMNFVGELLQRCDEPLGWWELYTDAIAILRRNAKDNAYDDDEYLWAARRGIKFFAECSADDPAAKARLARRRNEFQSSLSRVAT